jgi:L-ascorbate metabolism protein UlaG (beta-lactamase superfamily)
LFRTILAHMDLTWLDSNSWLIEIGTIKILLDPWLVDDLIFGNLPWLFKGQKKNTIIPEQIDLILLSQGLADHAHIPTLKTLDRNIPVVASPNATKVVQELGYLNINTLKHGESFTFLDQVKIKAVEGSPVGVNLVENGYLITDLNKSKTLYYEPHGYHASSLKNEENINIIITPLVDLKLPLLGAVIKGQKTALEVCQWLKPQSILPTAAGGNVIFEGILMNFLKEAGTVDDFCQLLRQNNLTTEVIAPQPGDKVKV